MNHLMNEFHSDGRWKWWWWTATAHKLAFKNSSGLTCDDVDVSVTQWLCWWKWWIDMWMDRWHHYQFLADFIFGFILLKNTKFQFNVCVSVGGSSSVSACHFNARHQTSGNDTADDKNVTLRCVCSFLNCQPVNYDLLWAKNILRITETQSESIKLHF